MPLAKASSIADALLSGRSHKTLAFFLGGRNTAQTRQPAGRPIIHDGWEGGGVFGWVLKADRESLFAVGGL